MQALVAVLETGSLTAAAERLGTAKSVISRRITSLETRLGARLLTRGARRTTATEAGAAFFERAKRILNDLDEAETSAAGLRAAPAGVLRVAAPMTFGLMYLRELVVEAAKRWPDLVIDLDLNDRTVDLTSEGHDMAVRIGRLPDSSLVARTIVPSRSVIVGSPAYLGRAGRPSDPNALRAHAGLLYTPKESAGSWTLAGAGQEARVYRIGVRLRSNNGEILRDAAVAGLGLAVLPRFMIADAVAAGRLEIVLPGWEPPAGSISAVYLRDRHLSAKVRLFINLLLSRFTPVPPWESRLGGERPASSKAV